MSIGHLFDWQVPPNGRKQKTYCGIWTESRDPRFSDAPCQDCERIRQGLDNLAIDDEVSLDRLRITVLDNGEYYVTARIPTRWCLDDHGDLWLWWTEYTSVGRERKAERIAGVERIEVFNHQAPQDRRRWIA